MRAGIDHLAHLATLAEVEYIQCAYYIHIDVVARVEVLFAYIGRLHGCEVDDRSVISSRYLREVFPFRDVYRYIGYALLFIVHLAEPADIRCQYLVALPHQFIGKIRPHKTRCPKYDHLFLLHLSLV